jgi:hypothetical protein
MMIMLVSVYFFFRRIKMALIDFIQVERVIIPNLKIQETINYVTYYFEKLEKQM